MDAASILGAINAAKVALDVTLSAVSAVTTFVKESGKVEVQGKVIELQNAMMELQQKHFALISVAEAIAEENNRLQEQLNVKLKTQAHHNAYWVVNEDSTLDGPFSMQKYDNEGKYVRMKNQGEHEFGFISFFCSETQEGTKVPVTWLKQNRTEALDEAPPVEKATSSGPMMSNVDTTRLFGRRHG